MFVILFKLTDFGEEGNCLLRLGAERLTRLRPSGLSRVAYLESWVLTLRLPLTLPGSQTYHL